MKCDYCGKELDRGEKITVITRTRGKAFCDPACLSKHFKKMGKMSMDEFLGLVEKTVRKSKQQGGEK